MDALDCIMTRRSIREFNGEPIDPELIEVALKAAMAAPSARNEQPWHFVLVTDRALLDKVPDLHPYASMARQAPAGILVCADPGLERLPGYWVIDCAAAVQNLLLALHAQGLGAVWIGVYPEQGWVENFSKQFGLPPYIIPHSFIPFGYPGHTPSPIDRYKPDRIHRNGW